MGEMAEENRAQSLGILAIVAGLGVAMAAAVMMVLLVVLLWFLYSAATGDSAIASKKPTKDQHIRDTGYATPELAQPGQGGGGRRTSTDPADPNYRDPSLGPPPGPVSIIIPKDMMFLSIEVNCPDGYRNRGDFRKDSKGFRKATVQNVPGDQRCTVTFQGSEPIKVWVTANQTLSCTFGPVNCSPVH
jgi:hypothetical protein